MGRLTPIARERGAYAEVARLGEFAPYALMALVVPGGSLMAPLFWLYRRQKKVPVFPVRWMRFHRVVEDRLPRLAVKNLGLNANDRRCRTAMSGGGLGL